MSHIMQLDDDNSQVSQAFVHFKTHNQPYIIITSSHNGCKVNETVDRLAKYQESYKMGKRSMKVLCQELCNYVQLNEVLTPISKEVACHSCTL